MTSILEKLASRKIDDAWVIHDYFQFVLDDRTRISVYNDFLLEKIQDIAHLRGLTISSVVEDESRITFDFSGGKKLVVRLDSEAWYGPEAMELNRDDENIVWN